MKRLLILFCLLLLLAGCSMKPSGRYHLTVPSDGIYQLLHTTPHTAGGCRNANGTPFRKGETVWLEGLEEIDDLTGTTITALDKNEHPVWEYTFSTGNFDRLEIGGWIIEKS